MGGASTTPGDHQADNRFAARDRSPASAQRRAWSALALALSPATVVAHHAIAGRVPATAVEGFISGIGHVAVGLDHLVVVLALGFLSANTRKGTGALTAFLAAALTGAALHIANVTLPLAEIVISISVVCFLALLFMSRRREPGRLAALALAAGLFHGYAYAESIVGAPWPALAAYAAGFTLMQLAVGMCGRALAHATQARGARRELPFPSSDSSGP
jgi:urease accessory protein